jgi:hypothetical protein
MVVLATPIFPVRELKFTSATPPGSTAPMPVKRNCRHGPGHERETDARPEPVRGGHDRVIGRSLHWEL